MNTVSNTFTGSGYGTVNDAANVVSNNNGTWGAPTHLSNFDGLHCLGFDILRSEISSSS